MIKSTILLVMIASTIKVTACAIQKACVVARKVTHVTYLRCNPRRYTSTSAFSVSLGHAHAIVQSKTLTESAPSSSHEYSLKEQVIYRHIDKEELKRDIARDNVRLAEIQNNNPYPSSLRNFRERLNKKKALLEKITKHH